MNNHKLIIINEKNSNHLNYFDFLDIYRFEKIGLSLKQKGTKVNF